MCSITLPVRSAWDAGGPGLVGLAMNGGVRLLVFCFEPATGLGVCGAWGYQISGMKVWSSRGGRT